MLGGEIMFRRRRRSAPFKFDEAYRMRYNPTDAEARMWEILKYQVQPNFPDHIFYRQSVQYGYIVDFYCPKLRLGLEVDGGVHRDKDQVTYDRVREKHLKRKGIDVRRVSNVDVFKHPEEVAKELCHIIQYKVKPWYKRIFRYSR